MSPATPSGVEDYRSGVQAVLGPLSPSAIFIVATIKPTGHQAVRDLGEDLAGLLRTVGFRSLDPGLSCVLGFGSQLWDRLYPGLPKPQGLHPLKEIRGAHYAPSTPGDLLIHIRANRHDLCFELAQLIMNRLRDGVASADEVHGFRYFDARDLLGFVDGTENPTGDLALESVLIGDEDPDHAGGSYVLVQKYVHDLSTWNRLNTEDQEKVIGRHKLSNVELDDDVKPANAHNALTVIEEDGRELKILRDNMPFGNASQGEFGTYFIGYSRTSELLEHMLTNMFIGDPPGNYDRILDFSTALTGSLYFVPSGAFLEDPPAAQIPTRMAIGDLKGVPQL
ncbi:Dyp-type peroxidase [Herbidospora cretacea]|uniref:Dyp-type peroxidase n=1 Tax=Herbidospora cretacea TaxID=28444 RepID=UPI00077322A7|nr:Dyp-type peroxidase [Herbidospora cretacea]